MKINSSRHSDQHNRLYIIEIYLHLQNSPLLGACYVYYNNGIVPNSSVRLHHGRIQLQQRIHERKRNGEGKDS